MWWDLNPALRSEFEDWHSHEHFPERMRVPGFLRGTRWSSATGGDGFFVMYELADYEILTSAPYRERLNSPTPWSTKMMPHHRNMVRSQCRVIESYGGGIAGSLLAMRFSPAAGEVETTRARITDLLRQLPQVPGLTSGHLLHTETPQIAQTTEQKIRGADAAADWILLVGGYDLATLDDLRSGTLSAASLGIVEPRYDTFRIAYSMTPAD
jgi:hypothetical protein